MQGQNWKAKAQREMLFSENIKSTKETSQVH